MSTATETYPIDAAREVLTPYLHSSENGQALIASKCFGLMSGYDARWRNAPFTIREVEHVSTSDLYNPETQRSSRTFTVAGKLDVLATDSADREVLFDHKTTSQDITDPNAPYWRQLSIEGQVSHYMLLEFLNGTKIDYSIWDVLRKPSIAPKLLTKAERVSVAASRTYFRSKEFDFDAFMASDRETPEMYALRVAHDCTTERPEWYFQRRQVPRLDSEIHEYATELWDHSQDMILARRNNRWPRNSGACMSYNSPCKFLGICSGYDTADSENWMQKPWVHPELPVLNGDGKDVLTNSRIRTFQTCRRKHQLQYELGIERIDEEEREALFFGSLFHSALEAYFLTLKSQQGAN